MVTAVSTPTLTLAGVSAILLAVVTWTAIGRGDQMTTKIDLEKQILAGSMVRVSKFCPYRASFPCKVGMVQKIVRDSVGPLYLVRLESGEDIYFRRAELVYLGDPRDGFSKNLPSLRKLNRGPTRLN